VAVSSAGLRPADLVPYWTWQAPSTEYRHCNCDRRSCSGRGIVQSHNVARPLGETPARCCRTSRRRLGATSLVSTPSPTESLGVRPEERCGGACANLTLRAGPQSRPARGAAPPDRPAAAVSAGRAVTEAVWTPGRDSGSARPLLPTLCGRAPSTARATYTFVRIALTPADPADRARSAGVLPATSGDG